MVITFNRKDLGSFGRYLLSQEREQKIRDTHQDGSLENALREVNHADVEGWLHYEGRKLTLDYVEFPTAEELQEFINGLDSHLSQDERSIVAENLNSFHKWVKNGMPMVGVPK